VRVQFPPPAPFDAAPTPSRASLMARQPSWAEANVLSDPEQAWRVEGESKGNVLSERSESKGSQQLDPLQTLTAIVTPHRPGRGDARGATVGQFAEKRRGWPRWPERAAARVLCELRRASGTLASGVRPDIESLQRQDAVLDAQVRGLQLDGPVNGRTRVLGGAAVRCQRRSQKFDRLLRRRLLRGTGPRLRADDAQADRGAQGDGHETYNDAGASPRLAQLTCPPNWLKATGETQESLAAGTRITGAGITCDERYSVLSALMGETAAARLAGMIAATNAQLASDTTARASASGSQNDTP
jgi:hypothetical protein